VKILHQFFTKKDTFSLLGSFFVMRKFLIFGILLVIIAAFAAPVSAVRYGQPDNGEHPYVGVIVFYNADGSPSHRCTGTMISQRVMLTAGHCSDLNGRAMVWFQENQADVRAAGYPFSGGIGGQAVAHPNWTGALTTPNTNDVGLVILDQAPGVGTAPLAGDGYLNGLATQRGKKDVSFEVVGYGLQAVKPSESSLVSRLQADVQLVNLTSSLNDGYNVQTTNNPGNGTGGGGTCFGDSGGAIFHNGNIVAVNSFVLNSNCAGASFGYRTDRAEILNWISGYVAQFG
jgi:secreted trypsin-like serine protease